MKRRSFLKHAAAGAAAMPVLLDGLTARASSPLPILAQFPQGSSDKILVVIQLFGGNDGLNTLIPALDDAYHTLRPDIRIDEKDCWKLANIYLHPALATGNKYGMARMLEMGTLAIVQGVGYDSPNLSHFRSTDIWLSGLNSSDPNVRLDTGWIGRMLEKQYPTFPQSLPEDPLAIQFGGFSLALMSSKGRMGIEVGDPTKQQGVSSELDTLDANAEGTRYKIEYDFVSDIAGRSNKYAQNVKDAYARGKSKLKGSYSSSGIAQQLASVAALIAGGLQTNVYVVSLGGFDTHVTQQTLDALGGTHPRLLAALSDAVAQFQYDMTQLELADRVLGLTVSEFGRRPQQNGSLGTDHGAASVQFVFGSQVNSGVFGEAPDLVNLNANGDLVYNIDYRQIYTELLTDWFGLSLPEAREVLQKDDLVPVDLVKSQRQSVGSTVSPSLRFTNFPNPFARSTTIELTLPSTQPVSLQVSDAAGRFRTMLIDRVLGPGSHRIAFEAPFAGTFICTLRAGSQTSSLLLSARP